MLFLPLDLFFRKKNLELASAQPIHPIYCDLLFGSVVSTNVGQVAPNEVFNTLSLEGLNVFAYRDRVLIVVCSTETR